jgi:hypothetical protein
VYGVGRKEEKMKLLHKILNVNLEYVWLVVFGLYAGLAGDQIIVFLVSGEMEKVNGLLFQFFLSVFMALCPTVISPYLRDFKKFLEKENCLGTSSNIF